MCFDISYKFFTNDFRFTLKLILMKNFDDTKILVCISKIKFFLKIIYIFLEICIPICVGGTRSAFGINNLLSLISW